MPEENDVVLYEVDQGVALITLNRPDRHNAYTLQMENEYFHRLREAAADPAVRVIVLTGSGRSFCPGMDAAFLADTADTGTSTDPELRDPQTIATSVPKPMIAAINGAAAGLGLIHALCCDIRFASNQAKMTTAFVRRGIMGEHGIAWLLPRIVGMGNAMDLLLSARVVMGEEALRMGLVNRICEPEDLLEETLAYAREMAKMCSPTAMGTVKRQVYAASDSTLEESRQMAMSMWRHVVMQGGDFGEGAKSFVEKRAPEFNPWDPSTPAAWSPSGARIWERES